MKKWLNATNDNYIVELDYIVNKVISEINLINNMGANLDKYFEYNLDMVAVLEEHNKVVEIIPIIPIATVVEPKIKLNGQKQRLLYELVLDDFDEELLKNIF